MLNSFVKRRQTTSALGRFGLQWLTEDFFRYFTKCPLVGDQAFVFFYLLFFFLICSPLFYFRWPNGSLVMSYAWSLGSVTVNVIFVCVVN